MKYTQLFIVFLVLLLCTGFVNADEAGTPAAPKDGDLPPSELFYLVSAAVISTLAVLATLFGGQLFFAAVWRKRLEKELNVLDMYHARTVIWGIAGSAFFITLFFLTASLGPTGELIALLIAAVYIIVCIIGSSAVCIFFGNKMKLSDVQDPTEPSTASLARGLAGISLGSLFPVIGWFLLFPYTAALSFGCFMQSMRMPVQNEKDGVE